MRFAAFLVAGACSSQLSDPPEVKWPAAQPRNPEAPFTLTASDGSGLALTRIDAKAIVEGPLAFTELHLYFHNDEARVREGRFSIALPAHAAVSRFAMQIDERMQEAEVVPKQLARQVYEDFLHRRQDPALLEKSAGNEFSARVFPIAPGADKHLVIPFSQQLAGDYVLPLRGLATVGKLDVALDVTSADGSHTSRELHQQDWRPDRDFAGGVDGPAAVGAGGLVAVRVDQIRAAGGADEPTALTVLVDTSASRALGYTRYVDSIGELVRALRRDLPVSVIAFDQDTQRIYDGPAGWFGEPQRSALLSRGAAGASDLGQALAGLAGKRVVAITDGVVTAGADQPALVSAIKAADRFDVVLAGGLRDDRLAAALAHAGKRPGDVYDLERGAVIVAAGLGERVSTDVPVAVSGASWFYPRRLLASRRSGDPVTIYARVPPGTRAVEVAIGDDRRALAITGATPALVQRAVASVEIDELEQQVAAGGDHDGNLRAEIATRSVASRVVSNETALLVLETERDYERYHIDRKSLADILVIGPSGLEQSHRTYVASWDETMADDPRVARSDEGTAGSGAAMRLDEGAMRLDEGAMGKRGSVEVSYPLTFRSAGQEGQLTRQQAIEAARNAGVLGTTSAVTGGMASLTGTGTIGEGRGSFGAGRGVRANQTTAPTVAIGAPTASGSLDRAILRRYIKRQMNSISYCYERELLGRPRLAGTITTQFLIDGKGRVQSISSAGFDATVARCVTEVIRKIEFPPIGSSIQVNYPFTFQLAGTQQATDQAEPTPGQVPPDPDHTPPLTGKLAAVMEALHKNAGAKGLTLAKQWNADSPGDVLAWVALGEAYEATHQTAAAARAYGSIIDLFPARADMRRFAGERLERVGSRKLVVDTYRRAVTDRPDHVTGRRLLAHAQLRAGDYAAAFATIVETLDRPLTGEGVARMIQEDAGIIGRAYLAHGGARKTIEAELEKRSLGLPDASVSTRFILYWETDVNDVDFHIRDSNGAEAFFGSRTLPSGGLLYGDITTGYGPECFTILGKPEGGPYQLSLHYYSQGPMGYGMGLLQVERVDAKGNVTFEDRPYVIMVDHAYVELGSVR